MTKYIYGFHGVEAFLKNNPERAVELYLNGDRQDKRILFLQQLAEKYAISLQECKIEYLYQLVGKNINHQGVVLAIDGYNALDLDNFLKNNKKESAIILILDGIVDPQNLGSILRSSDCFGVDAVIVPKDNSANYESDVVAKVSSGAVYNIPIIVVNNITRTIEKLKEHDFWIAGTALDDSAISLFDFKPTRKIAWVMGNEGSGIRRLVKENCDYFVMIPQYGQTQSLNVAVATGVILSYTRQQFAVSNK